MLEINHEYVQEIAQMPTNHSWAVELMKLPVEKADKAEGKVLDWIEEKVQELYPEADQAERLVRTVWLNLLENEAIEMWADKNPAKARYVPIILGPSQGVMYAEAEMMYAEQRDKEIAKEFLERMMTGELKPDLEKLMQTL